MVFAGQNYPRPSEVRNYYETLPDEPDRTGLEVFFTEKQNYPESVERDILLGVVKWLALGKTGRKKR